MSTQSLCASWGLVVAAACSRPPPVPQAGDAAVTPGEETLFLVDTLSQQRLTRRADGSYVVRSRDCLAPSCAWTAAEWEGPLPPAGQHVERAAGRCVLVSTAPCAGDASCVASPVACPRFADDDYREIVWSGRVYLDHDDSVRVWRSVAGACVASRGTGAPHDVACPAGLEAQLVIRNHGACYVLRSGVTARGSLPPEQVSVQCPSLAAIEAVLERDAGDQK